MSDSFPDSLQSTSSGVVREHRYLPIPIAKIKSARLLRSVDCADRVQHDRYWYNTRSRRFSKIEVLPFDSCFRIEIHSWR